MSMKYFLLLTLFMISCCGPSAKEIAAQEEVALKVKMAKDQTAIVTCNIMAELGIMDGALRIREINLGRKSIGEDLYLGNDQGILEALEWNICKELVLNDPYYQTKLIELKRLEELRIKNELDRIKEENQKILEEIERNKKEELRKKQEEEDRLIAAKKFPMFKARVLWTPNKSKANSMVEKLLDAGIPAYMVSVDTSVSSEDKEVIELQLWANPENIFYRVYAGPFLKEQGFENLKNEIIRVSENNYPSLQLDYFDYKVE